MRGLSISVLHRSAPLLFALLLLCAGVLPGQTRSPRPVRVVQLKVPLRLGRPARAAEKAEEPPVLMAMTGKGLPMNFELRLPTEARASLLPTKSYRVPVNLDLLLPKSLAGFGSTGFGNMGFGSMSEVGERGNESISSARQMFAQTFTASTPEPATHDDDLERYARRIPVVGSITQHIEQEQKAHRRIARIFEIVQPQPQF